MNTNDMNINDFAQYVATSVQEWADNNDADTILSLSDIIWIAWKSVAR